MNRIEYWILQSKIRTNIAICLIYLGFAVVAGFSAGLGYSAVEYIQNKHVNVEGK